jgi:alpha-glucosidase (family GH31 glycosyl hydrolase)
LTNVIPTAPAARHSFTYDAAKYPDPSAMIQQAHAAGLNIVLWISPSMTLGGAAYDEAATQGFFIRDAGGQPYVHRLGNEPGWVGSAIDFTYPPAVAWWQGQLRRLLESGIRGFKTDFGEQFHRTPSSPTVAAAPNSTISTRCSITGRRGISSASTTEFCSPGLPGLAIHAGCVGR